MTRHSKQTGICSVHENGSISETVESPNNLLIDGLINSDRGDSEGEMDSLYEKNPNLNEVFHNLKELRIQNIGRVIIATLNINSIRNKFEQLKYLIKDNIDILIVTETKIDETFPESEFCIGGFRTPYRLDRNANGGEILLYTREDIPSNILSKHTFSENIEGIFIEVKGEGPP